VQKLERSGQSEHQLNLARRVRKYTRTRIVLKQNSTTLLISKTRLRAPEKFSTPAIAVR